MSRFKFRLQAPLRLARVEQRELRRRLADEIRQELALDGVARALDAAKSEAAEDLLRRAAGSGIGGQELSLASVTIESVRERAGKIAAEQRVLRARLEATRAELAGVGRRLRVLERLEREAHRAHRLAVLRREQLELDDLTLVRRGAAGRGGRRKR